ncbi:MAG: amidohydrolase family protein [Nitrospinota bacterium]
MADRTLIKGRFVLTVDPEDRVIENGGVLVRGDRIEAVGDAEALQKGHPEAEVVEAGRHAVLPGLVNLHMHSGLIRGTAEDLPVFEWLYKFIDPMHRALSEDEAAAAARLSYAESLKAGTTCVLDMYRYMHRAAEAAERLGLRANLAPYVADRPGYEYFESLEDNRRLVESHHGAADGRVRVWLGLEHLTYSTDEAYKKVAAWSEKYDVGIHTHSNESLAMAQTVERKLGKREVELLYDRGILGEKTILAHCVWLSEPEMALVAETGTRVAHCPISNLKLASGVAPVPEMHRHGIIVGIGSDGVKENNSLELWDEMKVASIIQKGYRMDPTLATAPTLLRMATIDGARALGLGDDIGSLEPGKKADVVLVNLHRLHTVPVMGGAFYNVSHNLVYACRGSDVEHVMVDGKWVVRNGSLVNADEDEIIEESTAAARSLLERRKRFVPKDLKGPTEIYP